MASARFAWGIDVGNRALKAVKLVRDGDRLRVDDFELIEHETVLSNAGDNRDSLIQTALANFVQRHPNLKGGVVAVGVSGQQSFARFIKLPPVEPKKIPQIVRFEAAQQIPFPLDDVEWSYQLFQAPDSPDVEVGIFAMRKELVNRHIGYFTDFDLNVQLVQMNPLAVYNAMWRDERLSGTTMIIDLGAENTDLIIADNETIWMRSIPIGGNNFTETLVKAFKLPFAKAEDLKRNAQTSKYARQIFQAMRPVFADLVAEVQRSIGFYASVHRDSRIKKIIALGGTFRLPGLQKYLQQNLQLDVEKLDSLGTGGPTDPKIAGPFQENLSAVVGAYGLALQAMGEGKITSSLLPAAIRRERMWQEKTKWFGAAAALFVLGTGLAVGKYFFQELEYNNAQDVRNRINTVASEAGNLDKQWEEVASSGEQERATIRNLAMLLDYRNLWRNMIRDISNALPTPSPELQQAILSGDGEQVKKVAPVRGQRNIVRIESISTRYIHDMGQVLADPDFKRWVSTTVNVNMPQAPAFDPMMDPGMDPAMMGMPEDPALGGYPGAPVPSIPSGPAGPAPGTSTPGGIASQTASTGLGGPGSRGLLITIRLTSPNEKAPDLIEFEFIKGLLNLRPNEQVKKMEFGAAKAAVVSATQVKYDQEKLQKLRMEYDSALRAQQAAAMHQPGAVPGAMPGQPGMPGAGGLFGPGGNQPNPNNPWRFGQQAAPMPNQAELEAQAYKDRLTGEDVREDWQFTVLYAVILDPPAWEKPAAPEGEGQAAAQP